MHADRQYLRTLAQTSNLAVQEAALAAQMGVDGASDVHSVYA